MNFKGGVMVSVIFYLGSILLANWLVIQYGIIEIGILVFPAGAAVIGLTFSARDFVQKRFGKWWCWAWMFLASGLTYLLNQNIAIASVSAFLIAELIDWLVFTFTRTSFKKRIILSNIFSTPVDSVVFVAIAFGWFWPVIIGQTIVKFISSLVVLFIKDSE